MTRPGDLPAGRQGGKFVENYYSGFYIDKPAGNNAFSYAERKNKKIFVAPLIEGTPDDLAVGKEIAFSEIQDGKEVNCLGLKNFIHWERPGQNVFIFDNHNHAFFFWCAALKNNWTKRGAELVHIDRHKDTREPPENFAITGDEKIDLAKAFAYTNEVLNVGNFIRPALAAQIFSGVKIIDSREAFDEKISGEYILDLDMDVFSDEMSYIPEAVKIKKIRELMKNARLATVAASPYFMEQEKAIGLIRKIFKGKS